MIPNLTQLLAGEKPNATQLGIVEKELQIDFIVMPLPTRITITPNSHGVTSFHHLTNNQEPKSGKIHSIPSIVNWIELRLHMIKIPVGRMLAEKKAITKEDFPILEYIPMLVMYWYAKKWLPPYTANDKIIRHISASRTTPDQWLLGYKPDQETLDIAQNIMHYTASIGLMEKSNTMTVFSFGAGKIDPEASPPQKIKSLIHTAGMKVAKSCYGLEGCDSDKEFRSIILEGSSLVMYWTMKGWLEFPVLTKE
ncbi:MAG: hypothetical protein ACTSRK_13155 [Promethearchaeota archaeon]